MSEVDKQILQSILRSINHIAYTALIELNEYKNESSEKIKELKDYEESLEELINKLFQK